MKWKNRHMHKQKNLITKLTLNLNKYIEYILTKVILCFREKTFEHNGVKVKYLLEKQQSKTLIVVFSACTRKGVKARYNYVRTLKDINANKLFILDDFGTDHRGAYYLGKNCGNEIEQACKELIQVIKKENAIVKLLFCGSSKGGYAALNMLFEFKDSTAIVGAPQYRLGDYLLTPSLKETQAYVMPDKNIETVEYLNGYLKNKMVSNIGSNNKVYLHYSKKEHTYDDNVKYLIEDLEMLGIPFVEDCHLYANHSDISFHFPSFILHVLQNEI